jgi:hypothetical protein
MRSTFAALVLATLLASPAVGQENRWTESPAVGLGPLVLHAQSPLTILRLSPTPLVPVTLAAGQWQAGLAIDWANYFDDSPPLYVIDAEALRFSLSASYGVSDRLELYAIAPLSHRGGGILDRFIEDFEGLIGGSAVNPARKHAPRDRYLVRMNGDEGSFELSGRDAGWGAEDSVIGARYQLLGGTETTPALVAGLALKFPTGRKGSLYSSGGVDEDFSFGVGQRLGRFFYLYGELAATRYQQVELVGIDLTRTQYTWFGAVEYAHSPRTSYLVQALVTSPGAKHFGGFSKSTSEISFGLKRLVRPNLLFEAAITENVFVYSNSEDVAFHVGMYWRSGRPVAGRGRS